MELLPPLRQFGESEPDRAAHYSVMGNLLSLDISIYQRGTDAKKPGCSFDVYSFFKAGLIVGKLWIVTLVGGPLAWMLRKRLKVATA